uniref:Protein TIC 214 n=1 Tax=Gastrodia peichatieniana TaxID=2974004 RepID=A0A976UFD2_9ASPA|nr:hypothetical protein RF1 [Gastrodia peichatieniana]UVG40939.1 hypothetical protein RF1 [Gastrodia peichatieniana]
MKKSAILILVGLYYGFFTIFSIGPSFFFLIRYRVMKEGNEKEVSATTGFITGHILNVLSIYYTPLYKILVRPHLITILVIPYIYFILFYFNNNDYYYIRSTSIHNLSIQFIFFKNLIYQLLNNFILPSSALIRLVNIYMFKYNNKILFLTSSFCGWLISHILFIKSINSIVFWIKLNSYQYNQYKYNKYIITDTEFKNYINRIFSIFLFFICVSYLGRMPSPFFTRKFLDIEEVKIIEDEYSFERDYEINNRLEEDKIKIKYWFENIFVNFLFDYKRWNRPLRYINNLKFDKYLRKEMSQFLFFTCTNDGNKRISFTYPYSLSIFLENIDKKLFNEYIINSWIYTNEKIMCKFNDEFKKRIKKIEINNNNTEIYNIFEKRILLCDDKKQIKYLPNLYDPFFNGPNRININNMDTKSLSGIFLINNIYNILNNYYVKLSHNIIITYNMEKSILGYSENIIKYFQFLFDIIIAYEKKINNKYFIIRLNKIKKYISRWSYKLKERLEEEEDYNEEEFEEEDVFDINSRKFKHIIIYKENNKDTNDILISNNMDKKYRNEERIDEATLIHYSNKSDFRRNLIKGSMRAQRRKIVIWDLFQVNAQSPLFLDRLTNSLINDIIINQFIGIKKVKKLPYKLEKEHKYKDDQIEIKENWDNPLFNQVIRSLMLVIQSYFRKYILLPLLIIVKNILRVLFFKIPEWEKDFKEWSKEMHIKCTYNGVQLSETEFPEDWLIDGIQIKIIYPFCLKIFRKDKAIYHNIKRPQSFFLTVWGGETEHIFGDPRKKSFIFNPIYKEIKKIVNNFFLLTFKKSFFLKVSKKKNKKNIFCESSVLSQKTNISNIYLFQINIRDVYDKVFKIRKQTEYILKEKNNIIQYYKDGVLKSYMYFWIILVKKNIRLIRKSYYFMKLFIEKLYIVLLLYIITFYKIKVIFFFLFNKYYFMKFNTYIYKEQDIFYEINKNTINFILIIKKILLNTNKDPKFNSFLSYFSQAYVFYKLSQYQRFRLILIYKYQLGINKYNKNNKIDIYVKNYWKIWFNLFFKLKIEEKYILKTYEWYNKKNKYYEYNLKQSKIFIQTDKLIKDYYKLDYLVKKKRDKWIKNNLYDILLNKYIFNKISYIDISTLIVKINNIRGDQEIEYDFNKQKYKSFFVYYLNKFIPYTTKKKNRINNININILYQKYLDYRIINSHLINYRNKNIFDIFNFKYWFFAEFFIYIKIYKEKPWLIPIKSLIFNIYKRSDSKNKKIRINSNELSKKIIIYEDFIKLEIKNSMEKAQYTNNREAELYYFLKNSLLFQLRWSDALNKRIIKNIKVYCLLLRLMNPKEIYISSIQRSEIKVDDMLIQKDLVIADFINNGIFIFEPIIISLRRGGEHIIYQALDISLNKKYIINNKYKNKSNIFFPENILSLERRREFRFIICLNYLNISNNNKKLYNDKKILLNSSKYLQANKYFTNFSIYFIHLKMFLWPNFRVEDISCINRYWFNINNSSRFSILKLYMYSKIKNK